MRPALLTLLALVLALSAAPAADDSFVWWEGESPVATNFPDSSPFSASTFREKAHEVLSGGDWLTNDGRRKGPEAFARYRIRMPSEGEYSLWARKFWRHGPFRWRFDEGEWSVCGRDMALADATPIRTHLVVNWVFLGKVRLRRGEHRFEIRLLAGPGDPLVACFDCFALVRGFFLPRGKLRPGERSGRTEPGWWALEPSPDSFAPAALDLRGLSEEVAGRSGFVTREGDRLVLGDGSPARFWGVNCGPGVVKLGRDSVDYLARRLARSGVNLVRFHGPIMDREADDPSRVDRGLLDALHYFVAAMKEQGIYTSLSFYYPVWLPVRPVHGLPGYERNGGKPFALLFFHPRMQEMYRAWARALLATENPHTGLPLAKDPAVAIVEIVNEDSILFHTFKPGVTIPWPVMGELERAFGAWLTRRHGSVGKALLAWGGARQDRDRPSRGKAALLPAWNLTARGHGRGAMRRRASDQLRFLTEHVRAFYVGMAKHFRKDLGYAGLISCSNWQTADPRLLDPLERFTYTAGDVIDEHFYFGGRHEGEGSAYQLRQGHTFEDRAAVLSPGVLPFAGAQIEGWPHMISEIGWTNPNRFRADLPFLCATWGAQQGYDAFCFFAVSGASWAADARKFPHDVPTVRGQFPACALAFRRGDVREAETAVREVLDLEALFDFGGTAETDSLAGWVGRVLRSFGKPRLDRKDLSAHVDEGRRRVRSASGELAWDLERGVVAVETPRCQGATGHLGKAGRIELPDVVIESENEYGTVFVVSLDGKPLSSSSEILVQAMTEEKPFGYRTEAGRIVDLGGHPMLVREIRASVTLEGATRLTKAVVLDAHGHEREKGKLGRRGKAVWLRLPKDALYTILR